MDIFKTTSHFIITIPRSEGDDVKMEDAKSVCIKKADADVGFKVSFDGTEEAEEVDEIRINDHQDVLTREEELRAERKAKELKKRRAYWARNREAVNARRRGKRLEDRLALEKAELRNLKNKSK